MNATYKVVRRFFDKLCGINFGSGCSIVLTADGRTVSWLDQSGKPLTQDHKSPASLTEKYDTFVAAGVLTKQK